MKDNADNVLADVVNVALHGSQNDFAIFALLTVLSPFEKREQMSDRFLHHAG